MFPPAIWFRRADSRAVRENFKLAAAVGDGLFLTSVGICRPRTQHFLKDFSRGYSQNIDVDGNIKRQLPPQVAHLSRKVDPGYVPRQRKE